MNYKQRFNRIIEQIGDKQNIEGIQGIYCEASGYFSIEAKGLEIIRGCGGELYQIHFIDNPNWEIDNLPEIIKEWFDYVEEKVSVLIPSEVIIDGRKYRSVK